jgi:curved DNA-binding protein CbpA
MAKPEPDYYAVLGVSRTASQAEITHAYRCLLRRHHPDTRVPEDEPIAAAATLRRILDAYSVLRDPDRRGAYDRRHQPAPATPPGPAQPSGPTAPRRRPIASGEPPIRVGPPIWYPSSKP